ncbi:hypothetical protein CVT24_000724 [Panaeolus cyanescens]|uniref:Uncharacterized protein n=1 Tax=Panaeolus cyanescens TaxID=181874 RepID=A0A409YT53_9AGAR|nr:hypothetical protein CVT24_000724 [Panaeolus cyanescens]
MQFNILTLFVAAATFAGVSHAYVVELYSGKDCTGDTWSRNVWDNTCAYEDGFKSFKLKKHGGAFQQMTAYSRQACAGTTTFQGCSSGVNSVGIGVCHNTDSGSNALSSYSSGGPCPK